MENGEEEMISVREFDMERDALAVEEMELRCEVGSTSTANSSTNQNKKKKKASMSLHVDLLGDPKSRIRHCPAHVMLVAEYGEKREMVGVIRACIKLVTRGKKPATGGDGFVKVAYILGLRVSPSHRRLGIGTQLVNRVEKWCSARGAEYAYMATDRTNTASLNLFTRRLSYTRFRSPAVLVHPVHAHRLPLPGRRSAALLRLPPPLADGLYRRLFPPSSSEFFPSDSASLLRHPLTLGTFLALPSATAASDSSFAVMSLWNCGEVFRLRVSGGSPAARAAMAAARAVDQKAPWMRVPSVRDVFRPFGVYLMYGLHMEGEKGAELMKALCRLAHNIAMEDETCAAVVAEVGSGDPVKAAVPHWRSLSCEEDVWCMKRLAGGAAAGDDDDDDDDWSKSPASTEVIFVDPREF